jgi:hypothetical protein
MALQARPIHVPAGLPFDESSRAELTDVGSQNQSATNVRMWDMGTLGKRLGYASLTSSRTDGTTRSAGYRSFPTQKGLCTIDGSTLDEYSSTAAKWVSKGLVPEATQQPYPIPSLVLGQSSVNDCVALNGYLVIAWSSLLVNDASATTSSSSVAVLDADSRVTVLAPMKLGTNVSGAINSGIALASYGNIIVAFVMGSVSHQLDAYYLDTTSTTTVASGWQAVSGHIATDCIAAGRAVALSGGAAVAIAYLNTSAGVSQLTVKTVTSAGVGTTVTLNTNSTTPGGWDLSEGGTTLWAAWTEGTTLVRAQGLNPSTLATTATKATVITATAGTFYDVRVGAMASGNAAVYAQNPALWIQAVTTTAGAAATNGSLGKMTDARLVSRPTLIGSKLYAHITRRTAPTSGLHTDVTLCEVTPDTTNVALVAMYFRPVAIPVARGLFYFSDPLLTMTPNGRMASVTSSQFIWAYLVSKSGTSQGAAATIYDFASAQRWRPATVNGSTTVLSGGVASVFDGVRTFELNFAAAPNAPTASAGAAGAITFTNGGRSYVVTYADTDANGDIHTSGVSAPVISGNVTAKQINVGVSPLCVTSRATQNGSHLVYASSTSALRCIIWGTTDGGQPPYYYVGEIANDPTGAAATFVDNVADVDLISHALLYGSGNLPGTNGASQDHRAPPGLIQLVAYNGMLVGSSGATIWYSSQPIDGEGQWFSPIFTQQLDSECTGLFVQDGALFAFTRTGLWAMSGDPPSDNGSAGGLGTPRRLAVDRGCTNPNSILTTEVGTFFQTDIGIELFDRGQATSFIGKSVQSTLATYPVVTSAVLDTRNGLAVFSLAQTQTNGVVGTNGLDIVFDISRAKGWISRDDKRGSVTTQASQDAIIAYINGAWRYAWLASDGTMYYQKLTTDSDKCLDGTNWVSSTWELPPMKLGLQQEQRVYEAMLLFDRRSAAGLTVDFAHDFGSYAAVTPTKSYAESETLNQRQVELRPTRQRGEALQMRFTDTAPAVLGTGEGLRFIGVSADIANTQELGRGLPRLAVAVRK